MVLGILAGYVCNSLISPEAAKEAAGYFAMVTDIFLRLVKMIIAPLVFSTLVAGLAGMGDAGAVGRIGGKAVGWFLMASLASLTIGLIFANLLQPGANVGVPLPDAGVAAGLKTSALNLREFVTHVFPRNFFEAMANNEILQILVFSVFVGLALGQLRDTKARTLVQSIEEVVPVMLKVTDYVMRFAPIGVFAAVANVITTQGLGVLLVYGKFIGSFYLTLGVLWIVLIGAGSLVLKKDTCSVWSRRSASPCCWASPPRPAKSAYPRLMEQLKRFGISERISGFVLPLGYSFNLDGSMIYTTFAALFIAQAYDIPLSLDQQIIMLLVLMVSSKGIAGVPRSALVVVAAVIPMFNLPEAGVLLIMGIDHFLDMGRTATNVLGNGIATGVVAKWEGGLRPAGSEDEDEAQAQPGVPSAHLQVG